MQTELNKFGPELRAARSRFAESLATLPPLCSEVARRCFDDRVRRAEGKFPVSELAPWLLGELLDVDPRKLTEIIDSWFHVVLGMLILDDVLDLPDRSVTEWRHEVIVAELLIQRGASRLQVVVQPTSQGIFSDAFGDAADAAIHEIAKHRQTVSSFEQSELEQVGRKLALIQACAAAVISVSGVQIEWSRIENLFRKMSLGLQILDDLTDLDEDWRAGNFTLPITSAIRRGCLIVEGDVPRLISMEEVLARVVVSGALVESLAVAEEALQSALTEIEILSKGSTSFARYLSATCQRIQFVKGDAERVMKSSSIDPPQDWTTIVRSDAFRSLKRQLSIMAQGT